MTRKRKGKDEVAPGDFEKLQAEAAQLAAKLQGTNTSGERKSKPSVENLMEPADKDPTKPLEFERSAQANDRLNKWADKQAASIRNSPAGKLKRLLTVLFTSLSVALFIFRMWATHGHRLWSSSDEQPQYFRLFTAEQLAQHGPSSSKIYLSILGEVYDVSKAPQFYGVGGGYEGFAGRDATRSFITGKFSEDLNDEIDDFDDEQMAGLVGWKEFYLKEYTYLGRLIGSFFDEGGRTTDKLRNVLAASRRAKAAKEERERNKQRDPDCNKRWSQLKGGEVWCDDAMYPRILTETIGGREEQRCACFKELGWSTLRNVYPNCSPSAHNCQTSPPEGQQSAQQAANSGSVQTAEASGSDEL